MRREAAAVIAVVIGVSLLSPDGASARHVPARHRTTKHKAAHKPDARRAVPAKAVQAHASNKPAPPAAAQSPAPSDAATEPVTAAPTPSAAPSPKDLINAATPGDTGEKGGVSPAVLRAEVMLDRLHASPGVIDGRTGENFLRAVATFQKANNLRPTRALDEKTWDRLVEGSGGPALVDYTLTDKDVEGPFYPDLPKDYAELAKLKSIGYRSVSQKLGAKFHMGEELLAALNPGIDLSKAGTKIVAADVTPTEVGGKVARVIVDKKNSQVLGYDTRGHLLVSYPATIGSRELPSPTGSYRVKGIAWNPIYYYDPGKNFVQGDNKEKLKLPPGPNNPVGSVFIALTKPTYGLHGTPDPSKIDKGASHGCVRMTNWDASELAKLVRRGVVVRFRS